MNLIKPPKLNKGDKVATKGYVAIDFYDGSIMWDAKNERTSGISRRRCRLSTARLVRWSLPMARLPFGRALRDRRLLNNVR